MSRGETPDVPVAFRAWPSLAGVRLAIYFLAGLLLGSPLLIRAVVDTGSTRELKTSISRIHAGTSEVIKVVVRK